MRITISKVIFACVLVAGAGYGVTVFRGPHAFSEKHRTIEQLEKQNEALTREIAAKQERLDRLQKNPDELKLEIERRLMLVDPGSKSFILQDGKQQPESAPSTAP